MPGDARVVGASIRGERERNGRGRKPSVLLNSQELRPRMLASTLRTLKIAFHNATYAKSESGGTGRRPTLCGTGRRRLWLGSLCATGSLVGYGSAAPACREHRCIATR